MEPEGFSQRHSLASFPDAKYTRFSASAPTRSPCASGWHWYASPVTAACAAAIAATSSTHASSDSTQCSHSALSTSRRSEGERSKNVFPPRRG